MKNQELAVNDLSLKSNKRSSLAIWFLSGTSRQGVQGAYFNRSPNLKLNHS